MQIIAKNENILEAAQLIRKSPSKIHLYRTWNWDVVIIPGWHPLLTLIIQIRTHENKYAKTKNTNNDIANAVHLLF